ncbi:polymorphic toxin-type HINT domain-containing protein [Streptomyces sp. NPDC048340]|uniref:polymorphic toxin-type HINT domain-containing protein n=1 Tax=Streptomyces sp. NPDC048340 TaxID=3365537 RepID=UPI003720FCC0
MSASAAQDKYRATIARHQVDQFLATVQEQLDFKAGEYQRNKFWPSWLPSPLKVALAAGGIFTDDLRFEIDFKRAQVDIFGMIPGLGEPADGINCVTYATEGTIDQFWPTGGKGMWEDAALSCASMLPFVGWFTTPAKWARYADKLGPKARELFEKLAELRKKARRCEVGKNSFPAGTRVLMGDGSTLPIEQIKVGDLVLAADPDSGTQGPRRVQDTIYTPDDRDFTDITLAGDETITTTDHHPFWSEETRTWTDAADLTPGDTLRTPDADGARISAVRHRKTLQSAYNLSISDLHTYYVLAGETPVLVHNSTPCTPAIGPQRPTGVGDDWVARGADNGKGSVWQKSGSTGNADMLRVMNPTGRYPDGYVRFTNKHGQPIGLDGKPGSKADTHIPMNPDGTYPLPVGW